MTVRNRLGLVVEAAMPVLRSQGRGKLNSLLTGMQSS